MCNNIPVRKIQNVAFFINGKVAQLALDSGCEGDCIREDECYRLNLEIVPLDNTDTNIPTQADGKSILNVIGKVKFTATRDKIMLQFDGYVTKSLQSPILCGSPFLVRNKIVQELHNRRIVIDGKFYIEETSHYCPNPIPEVNVSNLSLSPLTGSFLEPHQSIVITTADNISDGNYVVIPKDESLLSTWHPQIVTSNQGKIVLDNASDQYEFIEHNEPLFMIQPVLHTSSFLPNDTRSEVPHSLLRQNNEGIEKISIGDQVPKKIKEELLKIHLHHKKVFDGDLSEGYNGFSGNFDVNFNFLNDIPPPISPGCVPTYNKPEDNTLLQTMIDRLEALKIVAKASSINIIPKFASPCMLVKKTSIRSLNPGQYENLPVEEKIKYNRFVLCQNKLNTYVQKIPAQYNKLEDTIRIVGQFEYVITTDLTDSFWQRHINKEKNFLTLRFIVHLEVRTFSYDQHKVS